MQATALEFAKKELSPHMSTWDAKEEFPVAVLKKSAELGFSGNAYCWPSRRALTTALQPVRRDICKERTWRNGYGKDGGLPHL